MELKDQIIQEYLATGCGYRKLQKKYGFSRTTICKWVQVYQGIHNLPPTVLSRNRLTQNQPNMDIQKRSGKRILVDRIPYRALVKKYGVSRSTIKNDCLFTRVFIILLIGIIYNPAFYLYNPTAYQIHRKNKMVKIIFNLNDEL